jgi:hypothetical protein
MLVTGYHWWPYCDCDYMVTDHHWFTLLWLTAQWLIVIDLPYCDNSHHAITVKVGSSMMIIHHAITVTVGSSIMVSHHAISHSRVINDNQSDYMVTDHHWFTLLWLTAQWLIVIDLPYCDWLYGDWPSLMTLLWLIVWWLVIIDLQSQSQ